SRGAAQARGGGAAIPRRSIDSDSARRRSADAGRREARGASSWRTTRAWEPSYPMTHARERGNSR
ncbi:putative lipid II flippase FtsW, partial [Nocardia nova]|nr:putative lipid II flippase FtsW [Nocardia nova]